MDYGCFDFLVGNFFDFINFKFKVFLDFYGFFKVFNGNINMVNFFYYIFIFSVFLII